MNCIQLALVALVACALSAPGADAALRGVPVARQLLNARELSGEERELWWKRAAEVWPDYDAYQAKTDRQIAVFVLEPREA